MKIKLPDGSRREMEEGATALDLAASISKGLARASVAARVNGKVRDILAPLTDGDAVELLKFEAREGREVFWHTSAHVMAQAVKALFPDVKIAIGPAIETGFYYDFDTPHRFTPEDFEKIEAKMREIASQSLPLIRRELTRDEALKLFEDMKEPYKVELINDLPGGETISVYTEGDFTDLCRGPHLPHTGLVKAFKLLSVAGAYWRGSEKNAMLQRIYGISFPDAKELREHLRLLEEAKRRDHRLIGREMDLFSFHEEGVGFPFWHANGMILYNTVLEYWRRVHTREGYGEVKTPIILNRVLWEKSGHWDHYHKNMYFTVIDEADYAVKPMNCPGGALIYKNRPYSYRDFPLKLAELGLDHRHELSGVLHGLFRVRSFTQDDAHVYCTPDMIEKEIINIIRISFEIYETFGFKEVKVELSTRPDDYMGELKDWNVAEEALKSALKKAGVEYRLNEGDGAFYGPKIDFHISDCMKRTWQCGTIQLDFAMPQTLDLEYIDKNDKRCRPVMIHRAILGSLERFIGILIEHYAGDFPLWLAPRQTVVIPVSQKFSDYAREVHRTLRAKDIRAELDVRDEKVGYKIRDAEKGKVPCMLVVGEEEQKAQSVSVRRRKKGDLGKRPLADLIADLQDEIKTKRIV